MAQLKPYKGGYYLWEYVPSLPAAIIFLILFVAATTFHFWKLHQTRAWFCLAFSLGGIFEVIGYIGRAAAHNATDSVIIYAIQNAFLLLGPTLFAASVYMTLGRIIRSVHAEKHSLVRINWLTKTFVMGDVVSFVVQGSASGLMATGDNTKLGSNIVVAGLVIQVIMFGLFIVTSAVFEVRMRRSPPTEAFNNRINWIGRVRTLYAVSALILIRSIFRVVEYAAGNHGYPLTHEWMLYVFDSALMIICMVIWGMWYPGTLPRLIVPNQEVVTEEVVGVELKGR
ncbi:Pc21g17190 [Penicillium rubens Wisconsin 54-1255]|uniref:Pc21g17190 protein n=1 Tax=Penicillium rubens (strain ATCC 28089 / DSM 1075 / NRRL 1951 / Wisconsin 54-1255) TaxID=500485 RepID=B6HM50_PENRW|nr:Pc21g17190 [Penicillium rubens Wisconsin 54-1255]